jgi:hypothetical protein
MLRTELSAMNTFIKVLECSGTTYEQFMFASADLGRPKWFSTFFFIYIF